MKEYLSYKDFELKVKEILGWDGGIGSTDQDLIKWKTHEIMNLAGIRIDLTQEANGVDNDGNLIRYGVHSGSQEPKMSEAGKETDLTEKKPGG